MQTKFKLKNRFILASEALIIAGLLFSSAPHRARALPGLGVPVNNLTENIKEGQGLIGAAASTDSVAALIREGIVHSIMISTRNWIRNGFQGSPSFIQDPGGFFTNVADEAAGIFVSDLLKKHGQDPDFFCKGFLPKFQLLLSSGANYQTRARCSITDIIGNLDDFMNDFENGGWNAWLYYRQPNNNPLGFYVDTVAEQQRRVNEAKAKFASAAQSSGGYLPQVKCASGEEVKLNDAKGITGCRNWVITTPAKAIGDRVAGTLLRGDLEKILPADELSEVVIELVNYGINQVLSSGLSM